MNEAIQKLREFHIKHRFPLDKNLEHYKSKDVSDILKQKALALKNLAVGLENFLQTNNELRIHRAHLMIEELAESILAMANNNEEELLDGLSDLQFVTIGTSESFGLPTEEGLLEVCDSNLTKATRQFGDVRLRVKGESYVPPDMKRVIKEHKK